MLLKIYMEIRSYIWFILLLYLLKTSGEYAINMYFKNSNVDAGKEIKKLELEKRGLELEGIRLRKEQNELGSLYRIRIEAEKLGMISTKFEFIR